MLRWLGLGLLFGTGFGIAWAQSSAKFDGQYRGELTLTKVIKGDCTQLPLGVLYPLRISRGEVPFVYVPRFEIEAGVHVRPRHAGNRSSNSLTRRPAFRASRWRHRSQRAPPVAPELHRNRGTEGSNPLWTSS